MNDEVRAILSRPTADVPAVGKVFFGLGKHASYRAAAKGDIATVRVGGRLRAITAPLRKLIQSEGDVQNGTLTSGKRRSGLSAPDSLL
jgi:hypothetical protein